MPEQFVRVLFFPYIIINNMALACTTLNLHQPAYLPTASFLGKNKDGKSHLYICLTYFITTLRFNLAVP